MFGRAKNLVRGITGSEAPRTQYYSVVCPDGHRLRGIRNEGYQAVRCPTCGLGMFILPRSPLPEPPAPPDSAGRRRRRAEGRDHEPLEIAVEEPPIQYADALPLPEGGDVEIVWLDQPPAKHVPVADAEIPEEYRAPSAESMPVTGQTHADEAAAASRARRTATRRQPAESASRPAESRDLPLAGEGDHTLVIPRQSWLRRHRVGVAIAGALVLAGSTIAYRLWRNELDALPQVADVNFTKGQEALDRGDFDAAKQMLARASSAFDRLGGRDERTTKARQLARESAIFADLCTKNPKEILDDAGRTDPAEWARRFEIHYAGRALIMDSEVIGAPEPGASSGAYQLAPLVFLGRGPKPARVARFDLDGFTLFEGRNLAKGDPVLFGARLGSVELRDGEWRIHFVPDSGVVLTQFKSLQGVGWSRELTSSARVSDGPTLEPAKRK